MRKLMPLMLVFALIFAVAFAAGALVAQGRTIREQGHEIASLREHNERLVKTLDLSELQHSNALTMAYSGKEDKEQLVEAMDEASEWLWMAEAALEELDRVILEQDSEADIPIIIRDIRVVLN